MVSTLRAWGRWVAGRAAASRPHRIFICPLIGLVLLGLWRAAFPQAPDEEVDRVLSAVVGVVSQAPPTARTAGILGTTRAGSGIVIDANGLVVTIGYLVLEASEVVLGIGGGRSVPAEVLGYDADSGFGLLRSLEPLDAQPMALGESSTLTERTPVLIASFAEPRTVTPALVVSVREFAAYWEYLVDDAIITSPPHPFFGGAALIGSGGELLGVGSLSMQAALGGEDVLPSNLFIPIDGLKPVLADLLTSGRSLAPPRPWLGIYVQAIQGDLLIMRLADEGPGERAGLAPGDVIVAINGASVSSLADFYRKLWSSGTAGVDVKLRILREPELLEVNVTSADRYAWYR